MIYFYIVLSAALVPILNNFFEILRQPYSWWIVPVLFIGFILLFIIVQFAIFAAMIQFTNLNKPVDKGERLFRFLLKQSLPIIVKVARVKFNFKGIEKLPQDTRMLVVCNHQHDFDPAVIISAFPDAHLGFIGKKEIYTTMPFVAKAMHRLRSLPIDRENDREAAKTIIKAIKYIKEDKYSVGIFPEGYASISCELLPLRNGCFKIATKTNVPIVVCAINNTRVLPKRIFRRKSTVELRLLDVLYPEQYEGMSTVEIGDIVHEKMRVALEEMRGDK
jgi:1-acyl-sn-glycerol-3-phosphate acyltransferase